MSKINLMDVNPIEGSEISPRQQTLAETPKIQGGSPDKKMSLMLHESLFGKGRAEMVEKQKKNIID